MLPRFGFIDDIRSVVTKIASVSLDGQDYSIVRIAD
jgi:hypothetical protein